MGWTDIVDRFGFPILILVSLGIFLERRAWPLVVSQINRVREDTTSVRKEFLDALAGAREINEKLLVERSVEREEFFTRLDKRDAEHIAAMREVFASLNRLDDNVTEVKEAVRRKRAT